MSPSDTVLVERWRNARDADAFTEIVTRYSGLVYGTCKRILRNAGDAEEVAQECFLALAEARGSTPVSLGGWFHTVATRRALDRAKSERRRLRRETVAADAQPAAAHPGWDDIKTMVDEAIAELPDDLRVPIVQRFLEGRTHEAIAETLGIPRSTVQHRIGKGLEQLAAILRKRGLSSSAAVLGTLLTANAVEAAPLTLTASIGKLLIASSVAPQAAAGAAAAQWALAGGSVIVAKKIALAAVVILVLACLAYGGRRAFTSGPSPSDATVASAAPADFAPPSPAAAESEVAAPGETASTAPGDSPATEPAAKSAPEDAESEPGKAVTRGRVVDAQNRGVPGASVVATITGTRVADATSGADGGFTLATPATMPFDVGAQKPGAGLGRVEKVKAGREDLVVQLKAGATISGRITDEATKEGIPGVSVSAEPMDGSGGMEAVMTLTQMQTQKSGRDGRYSVEVQPGSHRVHLLELGDYQPPSTAPPQVALAANGKAENIDFALSRGAVIFGNVFDASGKPCPDAHVSVSIRDKANETTVSTRSEEDGSYRLPGVVPNRSYYVKADAPPHPIEASEEVAVPSVAEVGPVDLHFSDGHDALGVVTDDQSQPLSEVRIQAIPLDANARPKWIGAAAMSISGADGGFALENLDPGPYRAAATVKSGQSASLNFVVPEDSNVEGLCIVFDKLGTATISGRVLRSDGTPAKDARVSAYSIGARRGSNTQSDADGNFVLSRLAEEALYCVTASYTPAAEGGDELSAMVLDVASNSEGVELVLDKPREFRGRVFDAVTGNPLKRFQVRVGEIPNRWQTFESETGDFRITVGLQEDTDMLCARADGYVESQMKDLSMPESGVLEGLEFALEPGASVTGTVTDESGKPLQGARVLVWTGVFSPGMFDYVPVDETAMAGPDGRFTLSGLAPGDSVNLAACLSGYAPDAVEQVPVNPQQPADVTLRLPVAAKLVIHTSYQDKPAPRTGIQVNTNEGSSHPFMDSGQTDADGNLTLARLRPGHYMIWASAESPAPGEWKGEIDLQPGQTTNLEIPLEPAGTIRGHVTSSAPPGTVLIRAQVVGEEMSYGGGTDAGGNFSMTLEEGKYNVSALIYDRTTMRDKVESDIQEVDIKGGETVDLEFELP